jgi:hypothetical protein
MVLVKSKLSSDSLLVLLIEVIKIFLLTYNSKFSKFQLMKGLVSMGSRNKKGLLSV